MIGTGMPRFDWKGEPSLSSQWNSQPMRENYPAYGDRGPYRITLESLNACSGMAQLLTEVEFKHGRPIMDPADPDDYLVLAGMKVESVLCRVVYSQDPGSYHDKFVVVFDNRNKVGQESTKAVYQTIEAAMTDFCKELMLVNPYDHIIETIGERGINHTQYQSIEEFGSWA